jgi:putative ABC transport system permease protein
VRDVLYLAWRYLAHHRFKSAVLVGSITVVLALPAGLQVLLDRSATALSARAAATPLVIGAKGSPLELVLDSLYFESDTPPQLSYAEVERVARSGLAIAVPLHTGFKAQGFPIVGTSPEYFEQRGLGVEHGRGLALLGECVLGADVAGELGLEPGDRLVSSPETVFDLAGTYPLAMHVSGVLARAGGSDDRAVFCDYKTTWVIAGFGHGHDDLARPESSASVLARDGDRIIANAAVREFTEITPETIDSFHFHGDPQALPITAVLVFPHDAKSATLLEGRYLGDEESAQVVRPSSVMKQLLETVLTVQRYITAAIVGIGLATLASMALVFLLSLQVRRREIETMLRLGCSRARLAAILATEVAGVLVCGVALAALLAAILSQMGEHAVRALVRLTS